MKKGNLAAVAYTLSMCACELCRVVMAGKDHQKNCCQCAGEELNEAIGNTGHLEEQPFSKMKPGTNQIKRSSEGDICTKHQSYPCELPVKSELVTIFVQLVTQGSSPGEQNK